MIKSKEVTQAKLIRAVGEVLAQSGFSGLGVNAVAKQAGVDKVLIYRYFHDFDSLCVTFARSTDFWPDIAEIIPDQQSFLALPLGARFKQVARAYIHSIRRRPITLEVMAWELIERNALTIELENVREEFGIEINRLVALPSIDDADSSPSLLNQAHDSSASSIDWLAVSALFSAGIQYLALRARKINKYNTIELNTDQGWQRLDQSIMAMIDGLTER